MNILSLQAIATALILECHAAFEALAWYVLSPSHGDLYVAANTAVMDAYEPISDTQWTDELIKASQWRLIGWISFWKYEY